MSKQEALAALQNYPLYNYYENQANVFAMFLAFDARTGTMQETMGTTYKPIVAIGKKRNFQMYMNHEDCLRIANIILRNLEQNPIWFANATKEIYKRAEELLIYSREIKEIKYKEKNKKELLDLCKKYVTLFKEMRVYSSIPTMLEHDTPVLSNLLKQNIQTSFGQEMENEVFSAITTPAKKSYLLQEEIERLEIAAKYVKEGKGTIVQEIAAHTRKWNWKEYMFEGVPLTEENFLRQIEEDIMQHKDPKERIKQINKNHSFILEKQEKFMNQYGVSEETKLFAQIAQDIVYLKYYRKATFAESYYCVEYLLKEIGERLSLNLDDVRAMFDWEVEEALTKEMSAEEKEEIKNRQDFCAFVSHNGKSYPLTREEALNIERNNFTKEEIKTELKGQVACSGNETGEVCLVNTVEDMKKMKQGMILVSMMTHPNLFPAMKIAKAIITDVGGLSCHAAIVARELNIPCIVGTKNATKILKDGMKVELETRFGTIKVIY